MSPSHRRNTLEVHLKASSQRVYEFLQYNRAQLDVFIVRKGLT